MARNNASVQVNVDFIASIKGLNDVVNKTKKSLEDVGKNADFLNNSKTVKGMFENFDKQYQKVLSKYNSSSDGKFSLVDTQSLLKDGEALKEQFNKIQEMIRTFNAGGSEGIALAKKLFPDEFKHDAQAMKKVLEDYKQAIETVANIKTEQKAQNDLINNLKAQSERYKDLTEKIKIYQETIKAGIGKTDYNKSNTKSAAYLADNLSKDELAVKASNNSALQRQLSSQAKALSDAQLMSSQQIQNLTSKQLSSLSNKTGMEVTNSTGIEAFAAKLEEVIPKMREAEAEGEALKKALNFDNLFDKATKSEDFSSLANLGIDTDKINKYKEALQEVQNYEAQLKQEGISPDIAANLDAAQKKAKELGDELKASQKAATEVRKSLKEVFENNGIKLDDWNFQKKNTIEELQNRLKNLDYSSLLKIQQELKKLNTSEADQALEQVNERLEEIKKNTDNIKRLSSEFNQLTSHLAYFFSLQGIVRAFTRTIKEAFEATKKLDASMTEIAIVSKYSVGDMWKQLPQFTANANALGVSIKDAYEATTLFVQQGLDLDTAMGVSQETLKMARISGLGASEATDAMTSALHGFNMEVNAMNAEKINDVYSALAAASASNVEELSIAMSKTASIASNAGMSFENTATFLAQVIEATREAPETAGTMLKTVIARFSEVKKLADSGKTSGTSEDGELIDVNKVATALKTANIDMTKFFKGEQGLDEIFLQLAEKWDTLTTMQQRYIATQAAGSRQQSRFIALLNNYQRTRELQDIAMNAEGASSTQFGKTVESLENKLQKLSNAWQTFITNLANNAIIKAAVDILTTLLTIINSITSKLGDVGASLMTFTLMGGGLFGMRAILMQVQKIGLSFFTTLSSSVSSGIISGIETARSMAYAQGVAYGATLRRGIKAGFTGQAVILGGAMNLLPAAGGAEGAGGAGLLGLSVGQFAAIIAVLVAIAATIAIIYSTTHKWRNALKEAEKTQEKIQSSLSNSVSRWESITQAVESYSKAVEEAGTNQELLQQAQDKGWDLITDYDLEYGVDYTITANGVEFDEDSIKDALEKAKLNQRLEKAIFGVVSSDLSAKAYAEENGLKETNSTTYRQEQSDFESQLSSTERKAERDNNIDGYKNNPTEFSNNYLIGDENLDNLISYIHLQQENENASEQELIELFFKGKYDNQSEKIQNSIQQNSDYAQTFERYEKKGLDSAKLAVTTALGNTTGAAIAGELFGADYKDQLLNEIEKQKKELKTENKESLIEQYMEAFGATDSEARTLETSDLVDALSKVNASKAILDENFSVKQLQTEIDALTEKEQQLILDASKGKLSTSKEIAQAQKVINGLTDSEQKNALQTNLNANSASIQQQLQSGKETLESFWKNNSISLDTIFALDDTSIAESLLAAFNDIPEEFREGFGELFTGSLSDIEEMGEYIRKIDFSDLIKGAQQLRDTINDSKGKFSDIQKEVAKNLLEKNSAFSNSNLFKSFYQNNLSEIQSELNKLKDSFGNLDGKAIREAAKNCEALRILLENTGFTAESLATALNAIAVGDLSIDDFNDQLIEALRTTNELGEAVANLLAQINGMKPGDSATKAFDKVKEFWQAAQNNIETGSFENLSDVLNFSFGISEKSLYRLGIEKQEGLLAASDFLGAFIDDPDAFLEDLMGREQNDKIDNTLRTYAGDRRTAEYQEETGLYKGTDSGGNTIYWGTKDGHWFATRNEDGSPSKYGLGLGEEDVVGMFTQMGIGKEYATTMAAMAIATSLDFDKPTDPTTVLESLKQEGITADDGKTYVSQSKLDELEKTYSAMGAEEDFQEALKTLNIDSIKIDGSNAQILLESEEGKAIYNNEDNSIDLQKFAALSEKYDLTPEAMLRQMSDSNPNQFFQTASGSYSTLGLLALMDSDIEKYNSLFSQTSQEEDSTSDKTQATTDGMAEAMNEATSAQRETTEAVNKTNTGVSSNTETTKNTAKETADTVVSKSDEVKAKLDTINTTLNSIKTAIDKIKGCNCNCGTNNTPAFGMTNVNNAGTPFITSSNDNLFSDANNVIDDLINKVQELQDTLNTSTTVTVNGEAALQTLQSMVDLYNTLVDKVYNITENTYRNIYISVVQSSFAGSGVGAGGASASGSFGRSFASGGYVPKSGKSLVGELGPELVVDPNTATWQTVGNNGAEMVNLPNNAIIFNHKQTQGILRNGSIFGRGTALASGNAFASGETNFGRLGGFASKGSSKGGGGGGGAGGESSENANEKTWANPYDWLYNLTADWEESLRKFENLEDEYKKLLKKDSTNASMLYNNLKAQEQQLNERKFYREKELDYRKLQMNEYEQYNEDLNEYAKFNWDTMTIDMDWDLINGVQDTDLGERIEKYVKKLEEIEKYMDEAQEDISTIDENLLELETMTRQEYIELENRVVDAMAKLEQNEIDKLSQINTSVQTASQNLLTTIRNKVDQLRQDRQNAKTEQELFDKQQRLAYLQQDTSGANQVEIKQLQKELDEAQEDYTDTLVDQQLSAIEKNDSIAQQQREDQINLLQAALDAGKENGVYNERAAQLIQEGVDQAGKLLETSELVTILKDADLWTGMSKDERDNWFSELLKSSNQANTWLAKSGQLEDLNITSGSITFTDAKGNVHNGLVDDNGNVTSDEAGKYWKEVFKKQDGTFATYEEIATEIKDLIAEKPSTSINSESVEVGHGKESDSPLYKQGNQPSENPGDIDYGEDEIEAVKGGTSVTVDADDTIIQQPKTVQIDYSYDPGGSMLHKAGDGNMYYGYIKVSNYVNDDLVHCATGGLADFTGPAWLDGTKTHPELVLNAQDTKNFIQLKDILSSIMSNSGTTSTNTSAATMYNEININASIGSDYDVDRLTERIQERLVQNSTYRSVNTINRGR